MKPENSPTYWIIIFTAAILEFGGDALIRKGEQKCGFPLIIPGFLALGFYGIVVNLLSGPDWVAKSSGWDLSKYLGFKMNFSELLGIYVAAFALVSVVCSSIFIDQKFPKGSTIFGVVVIIAGGLIIQYGSRLIWFLA
jgi:multidrug transporter EmrE-like cation transporter